MCLFKSGLEKIKDGDLFTLTYKGASYPFEAKDTPNGVILVTLNEDCPVKTILYNQMKDYQLTKEKTI